MSVSPTDLLSLANHLLTPPEQRLSSEVEYRTSLGRAYYAAYHDCTAWHHALPAPGSLGNGSRGMGVHAELYARLSNPDARISKALNFLSRRRAYMLRPLHGQRCKADYELAQQLTLAEAQQGVANAGTIVALV